MRRGLTWEVRKIHFCRDEVSRDTQVLISAGSRCRYFHLYLNGQYWGLYDTDERPNGDYGEQYFGGKDDEYDVLKSSGASGGYATEATDGTMDPGSGMAAPLERSPHRPPLHRPTRTTSNFSAGPPMASRQRAILRFSIRSISPTICSFSSIWGATMDRCRIMSAHQTIGLGMRRRGGTNGFRFFVHDFEQSLGLEGGTNQRVGKGANIAPWSNTVAGANDIKPQ
jgi:hypothetical protein